MKPARKVSKPVKSDGALSASQQIDGRIRDLGDWRGDVLSRIRALIKLTVPDVTESWKWRGVPVWECDGIICTGETYKAVVKLTFMKGAALDDPSRLFNASLDGNARRAIDIREGDRLDERALKSLFRAAADLNRTNQHGKKPKQTIRKA